MNSSLSYINNETLLLKPPASSQPHIPVFQLCLPGLAAACLT
jgi:hypothetical protein